jgi:hypothetical protein
LGTDVYEKPAIRANTQNENIAKIPINILQLKLVIIAKYNSKYALQDVTKNKNLVFNTAEKLLLVNLFHMEIEDNKTNYEPESDKNEEFVNHGWVYLMID